MYYSPQGFDPQAFYQAQISSTVLAPANRTEEGYIKLKTNSRNLWLYFSLFVVTLAYAFFYLFMFGENNGFINVIFVVISFLPSAVILGLTLVSLFKQKIILIGDNDICIKYLLGRKKVYTYDRISSMQCFPSANVSGNFYGNGAVPVKNLIILTFDDKRNIKLPVIMQGFADVFEILSNRTSFQDELSKVIVFYFKLKIDIRNKCIVQENIFSGMGQNSDPTNPFEGF